MIKNIRSIMISTLLLLSTSWSTNYYIDAISGDDNKNGQTISNAFKSLTKINGISLNAGDTVLFKAGSKWTGQFSPKGSGSNGNPIVVDMYGSGNRPLIEANGTKPSAIYLINQQYWEINDLEITNSASSPGDFRGIWITGRDFGILKHIYIKNCYVHNVTGVVNWISGDPIDNKPGINFKTGWDASKRTGGIVFETLQPGSNPIATKFDDVLIESNQISDCSFGGIITKQWDGTVHWGTRSSATDKVWVPHSNFIIRKNYISQLKADLGCNGIYLTGIKSSTIEDNVVEGAGTSAIELYYADSVNIQKNETFGTIRKAGGTDYNGIDPDKGTTNIIVQYNYSHNNGDGILLCQFAFGSVTARYNIIQNNSRYQIYLHSDKGTVAEIYNNTIYNNQYNSKIVYGYGTSLNGTYRLVNNIFVSTKTGADLTSEGGIVYDNNSYFGPSVVAPAGDSHKITVDPKLINPGQGTNGSITGPAFASLEGYKLQQTSPVINKGIVKSNNGNLDFWGNTLYSSSPDLGAFEYGTTQIYTIELDDVPGGRITQNPVGTKIAAGTPITFTATPLHGWAFSNWTGSFTDSTPIHAVTSLNSDMKLGALFHFTANDSINYEAENTRYSKSSIENVHAGFSGTGYINFDNLAGSLITFDVLSSVEEQKTLSIRYSNGTTDERSISISINGQTAIESMGFASTNDWDTWNNKSIKINLKNGINSITLKSLTANGGPNIDAIEIDRVDSVVNRTTITKQAPNISYNPYTCTLQLRESNTTIILELIDMQGKLVLNDRIHVSEGINSYKFSTQHLKTGNYFIKIHKAGKKDNISIPIVKY